MQFGHMPETLRTERLILRRNSADYASEAAEAIDDSIEELRPWQSWVLKHVGVISCEAYSQWAESSWGSRFDYQIFRAEDNHFLGQVALERFHPDVPSVEVGYWLRTSATGRGYMTEASAALVRTSFEVLHVIRIQLLCDERNTKSAAVAKRLGFTLEGVLRNERRDTFGEPQNTMVWSMIAPK